MCDTILFLSFQTDRPRANNADTDQTTPTLSTERTICLNFRLNTTCKCNILGVQKCMTFTLTQILFMLFKVPCSRADVFSSKKVSMLEKRMLMKFLQFCLDYQNKIEEIQGTCKFSFAKFLDI